MRKNVDGSVRIEIGLATWVWVVIASAYALSLIALVIAISDSPEAAKLMSAHDRQVVAACGALLAHFDTFENQENISAFIEMDNPVGILAKNEETEGMSERLVSSIQKYIDTDGEEGMPGVYSSLKGLLGWCGYES